ncbi:putative type VI secretion system effector [Enterobacteriaceae bacterium LUAb1]
MISAEVLQRFKCTEPDEILEDAQQRLGSLPEEVRQNWQKALYHETKGYRELDDLRRYMHSRASLMGSGLEAHQKYLASHSDDEFTAQEIQEHNEYIDDTSLYFVFLADEIAHFPPLPVLPPPSPLIKISGIIEEVTFTRAMACFEAEVYSTVRDELERKRQRDNIGALVAMTAQALAGTPPHAMINEGKPSKLKCLYVKGKIDGKTFSGWFGMTNIRPGDRVEIAAAPVGDEYLAYAIARPEQRTISLTPRCNTGKESVPLKMAFLICFILASFLYIPALITMPDMWVKSTVICILFSLSFGRLMQYITINKSKPFMLLFDEISNVLSLEEYKKKYLYSFTKKKVDELKSANKWLPREQDPLSMPQRGMDYLEEYFYYY